MIPRNVDNELGLTWSFIFHLTDEKTELQKGSLICPGSPLQISHGSNFKLELPPLFTNRQTLKVQSCLEMPGFLLALLLALGLLAGCDNDHGAGCVPVLTFQVSQVPCVTTTQRDDQVKEVYLGRVFAKSIF